LFATPGLAGITAFPAAFVPNRLPLTGCRWSSGTTPRPVDAGEKVLRSERRRAADDDPVGSVHDDADVVEAGGRVVPVGSVPMKFPTKNAPSPPGPTTIVLLGQRLITRPWTDMTRRSPFPALTVRQGSSNPRLDPSISIISAVLSPWPTGRVLGDEPGCV
jgi:hypothetical protein